MLMIRLSRVGKKKEPSYRLIVSEKTKDPFGDYLEILGFFNPRTNPPVVTLKSERITHWISKGAQASDTVHNLLVDQGVLQGPKRKVTHKKKMSDEDKKAAAAKEAPKAEAAPAEKSGEAGSGSAGKPEAPNPPVGGEEKK